MRLFLVILLFLSINIYSQEQPFRDKYQYIMLTFNELMSTDGLFNPENYVVYDETGDTVRVVGAGWVKGDDTTGGVMRSAIATERWKYDVMYTVKVYWVKDIAGNLIAENNYTFTFLPLVDTSKTPTQVQIAPGDL